MENYCNNMWPLIYDQYNHGRHEQELAFYCSELASYTGQVLEVACGTGMILLPLLDRGLDVYGFDLSQPMLDVLFAKAERAGRLDIRRRITRQNMVDFRYDMRFEAIFIPGRSFLHLTKQQDQIACLKNVHRHLCDGGRLMLNFFAPSLWVLLDNTQASPEFKEFGTYQHPQTGKDIKVSFRQTNDLSEQIQYITWRFQMADEVHDCPMFVRWIYKNEFELLARLADLRVAALYSGFEKSSYDGEGEMVWVLEKAPAEAIEAKSQ